LRLKRLFRKTQGGVEAWGGRVFLEKSLCGGRVKRSTPGKDSRGAILLTYRSAKVAIRRKSSRPPSARVGQEPVTP